MPINTDQCDNWSEHVILGCPSLDEIEHMVTALGTAEVMGVQLQAETASWMSSLIGSLAEFMDEDAMNAFIVRLVRFFYLEAMSAGQVFHQSTAALLDRPPESQEKWKSVCAALVAGTFRTTFEQINDVGRSSLSDSWETQSANEPRQPPGNNMITATTTVTTPIPDREHAPVIQAEQNEQVE